MSIKSIKLMLLSMVVAAFGLLTSCGLDDLNLSGFTIDYPANGGTYIGRTDAPPPANAAGTTPLASEIKISYSKPLSGQPKVSLNGHGIEHLMTFGPNQATVKSSEIASFLRQGRNTLSVEPTAFGPTITFNYDGMGPTIIVESGQVTGTSSKTLQLKGYLRDFSAPDSVMDLELNSITGYNGNGTLQRTLRNTVSVAVDSEGKFNQTIALNNWLSTGPLLYRFTARDTYGYKTTVEYMADTADSEPMKLQNAVRVAIGDTFVASMRPVIASSIKNTLDKSPLDARCVGTEGGAGNDYVSTGSGGSICKKWNDTRICGGKRGTVAGKNITQLEYEQYEEAQTAKGEEVRPLSDSYFNCDGGAANQRYYTDTEWNKDGGTLATINQPVKISMLGFNLDGYIQRFYMHDGETPPNFTVGGENLQGKQGTMLLNQFEVLPDNKLQLNLAITEMVVALYLDGGAATIRASNGDGMSLYIQNIIVDTQATINKTPTTDLKVELVNSNFSLNNVKMNDICVKVWIFPCVGLTGLANLFLPLLEGLVADLLQDILNPILADNLKKIVIGGTLTQPENQTSLDAALDISELGTKDFMGLYDLKASLDSKVDVKVPDPYAPSILGPVYFDDPINPQDVFNGTSGGDANLTVAVNSNLLNAVLAAMHATGTTFFTFYNGKVYYGAHPNTPAQNSLDSNSPTIASVGDTRIRLWPDTPPVFKLAPVLGKAGASRAEIKYDAATLYQDTYKEVNGTPQWVNNVEIQVDFDLGVEISEDGQGRFTMGASGPPVFNINKIINRTKIQVPPAIIQGIFDIAMTFGGNALADQLITFDFNKLVADNLNGTTVQFLSDKDQYKITGTGENECIVYENGVPKIHPQATTVSSGSDGKYDVVCYTLQFDVATQTAGTTGTKGTNLFFQMKVADKDLPPPPSLPRLDLDGDYILDYRDNCKVSQEDLQAAMTTAGYGSVAEMVHDCKDESNIPNDPDLCPAGVKRGDPLDDVEDNLRAALNGIYNGRYGVLTQNDRDWYNARRAQDGDPAITANNWVDVLFSNPSQRNTITVNGELTRIGNLCQPDDDRDGIYDFADNCPGISNPGQEVNGVSKIPYVSGDIGDACHVQKTFVMIRSLGSKMDTGTYQCLTHEFYKNTNNGGGSGGGVTFSRTMKQDNGRITKNCDPADINQRWYLTRIADEQTKLAGLPSNAKATNNGHIYHLYADPARDNTNSWQLVAQVSGNGELRMAKMNSPTRLFHDNNNNDYVAGWVLDVDPAALSSNTDDRYQPWIIRSWKFATLTRACLFYNNGGWGPDIDADRCASTYMNIGNGGLNDLWFRWGIYIGGTQLWDSSY